MKTNKSKKNVERDRSLETPKGVRDFLPEQKILREQIVDVLKKVFERYGFNPIETPALEMLKTLVKETDSATDAFNEIYRLEDQGGRKLALKYDQTVPFGRVVAQNPQLGTPFKRYQIDRSWRDGPIKLGRYREFWQCDVDIAGASSMIADAEYLAIVTDVFKEFEIKVEFRINNRKLVEGVLKYAGIPKKQWMAATIIIDKLDKIGDSGVLDEARQKGINDDAMVKVLDILSQKGTNLQILKQIESFVDDDLVSEAISELRQVLKYGAAFGAKNIKLVPSLARGLSYYTGTIFETYVVGSPVKSSVVGGGRFDNMIGDFVGKNVTVPAVGLSFGLDVIYDTLVSMKRVVPNKTVVKVFVVPLKTEVQCIKIVTELRNAGINADIDLIGRSISKNLQYANKLDIPYVILAGQSELKKGKLNLKDMKSGKEQKLTIQQIIKKLK
jgi:histidyl-tRNA synthetase